MKCKRRSCFAPPSDTASTRLLVVAAGAAFAVRLTATPGCLTTVAMWGGAARC